VAVGAVVYAPEELCGLDGGEATNLRTRQIAKARYFQPLSRSFHEL
jgi:hypothetical protein